MATARVRPAAACPGAPRTTAIDEHLAAIAASGERAYSYGFVLAGSQRAADAAAAAACEFSLPGSMQAAALQHAMSALQQPPAVPSGKLCKAVPAACSAALPRTLGAKLPCFRRG